MTVKLNHIIIPARDRRHSAEFLAGILGLPVQPTGRPFTPIELANGVTLDFMDATGFSSQHCAFLLSEDEFDAAYAQLMQRQVRIWADPDRTRPAEINHHDGGRGLYFDDPDGHLMEILTQPHRPDPETRQ